MEAQNTIFDKIINKEIPAKIEYEDDICIAIRDINPQAPVHCLVIPKKHITRLSEAKNDDKDILGHILIVATKVAKLLQIHETGFRIVVNNGKNALETVPHLHVHILGGRLLQWPPG